MPGRLPIDYVAFKIGVPPDSVEVIDAHALAPDWRRDLAATRMIGDAWLSDLRTLALAVPSAVLPHSTNLLLNPLHPRAGELRVISQQPFRFDPRLRPPP